MRRTLTIGNRRYVNPPLIIWYPVIMVMLAVVFGIIVGFGFVVYWVLNLFLPSALAVFGAIVALISACKFNGKYWWQHL